MVSYNLYTVSQEDENALTQSSQQIFQSSEGDTPMSVTSKRAAWLSLARTKSRQPDASRKDADRKSSSSLLAPLPYKHLIDRSISRS
jgi:hypothetical protein